MTGLKNGLSLADYLCPPWQLSFSSFIFFITSDVFASCLIRQFDVSRRTNSYVTEMKERGSISFKQQFYEVVIVLIVFGLVELV